MQLDVRATALGGRKTKQLFEALLAAEGGVVSKAELIGRVWDGAPPRHAEASLATYITVLRHRLEPGVPAEESVIVEAGDGFRFTLADRRQFARAV